MQALYVAVGAGVLVVVLFVLYLVGRFSARIAEPGVPFDREDAGPLILLGAFTVGGAVVVIGVVVGLCGVVGSAVVEGLR